jgi:hypothetical protein
MSHTKLLCFFLERARIWNWKLRWHATIAQNLWFNHIFDLYNIFLYIFNNKFYFKNILQFIFIFIQKLLERTLYILDVIIYLYINSNDDPKPCKV